MKKIGIIMGSDSDLPVVQKAADKLKALGVPYEAHIYSAHSTPAQAKAFAENAEANDFGALIAFAGKAAHLAGAIAANTCLPVIGVPVKSSTLDGLDALLSTVQMPSGIPVATVAIDGAADDEAACRIVSSVDASLLREAIEELPREDKEVLLMHYFMDLPVARIARILSAPEGTVKWRLHGARLALGAKLGAVAKKPGGKALLIALALCGLTALGAAVWSLGGREAAETVWTGETGGTAQY